MMTGIYKSVRYQNEAKLKYQVDGGPAVNEQTAC